MRRIIAVGMTVALAGCAAMPGDLGPPPDLSACAAEVKDARGIPPNRVYIDGGQVAGMPAPYCGLSYSFADLVRETMCEAGFEGSAVIRHVDLRIYGEWSHSHFRTSLNIDIDGEQTLVNYSGEAASGRKWCAPALRRLMASLTETLKERQAQ